MEPEDTPPTFRELARDALRYWEGRRLLYNLVLLLVVAAHLVTFCILSWVRPREVLTLDSGAGFFILAVIANICYCAAYPVDLLVQYARPREGPGGWRNGLFFTGTVFAAVLACFVLWAWVILMSS